MGSGPRHKPVSLKVLRMGEKQAKQLLRKQTPVPGPIGEPPDTFTPAQREAWAYAVENAPRDVLKRIDKYVLAAFIVAADTHRIASEGLNRSGLLVKTENMSYPQQNPFLPIMNRQMMLMIRAASELGFTPCSRARIDSDKPAMPESVEGAWEDAV